MRGCIEVRDGADASIVPKRNQHPQRFCARDNLASLIISLPVTVAIGRRPCVTMLTSAQMPRNIGRRVQNLSVRDPKCDLVQYVIKAIP